MYIGHRIVHASIAFMSATRAIAYSPLAGGPHDGAGPMILSDHGEWMWLYVMLWVLSFCLSSYALIRGRGEIALLVFIFLCFSWAGGYATAWLLAGFQTDDWMTASLYAGIGLLGVGAHRLLYLLQKYQAQALTGLLPVVRGQDGD